MRCLPLALSLLSLVAPQAVADTFGSAQDALVNTLPGDHNAWSHAIDAAATQSGVKSGVQRTEGYVTTKATDQATQIGIAPYIGAVGYSYRVIRARKTSFVVNDPILGRHRITIGTNEASMSDINGLFGFKQSVGVDTTTGQPRLVLGISRSW